MKRKFNIIITLCFIFSVILISIAHIPKVEAANMTVSKSNVSLEIGKSTAITVNASTHTGRVDVSISNASVATVSTSSFWVENNSQTITITAKSEGNATITIQGELYDSSTEEEKVFTKTINVTVTKPVVQEQPKQNAGANNQSSGTTSSGNSGTTATAPSNSSTNKKSNNSVAKASNNSSTTAKNVEPVSQNNDINVINSEEPINEQINTETVEEIIEPENEKQELINENEEKSNAENTQKRIIINKEIIIAIIAFIAGLIIGIGIPIVKKIFKK